MSQLLISILGIVAGIAAALVAALVTVWREYKKDIKERYEERADVYKREHFKRLVGIIKENLENQRKFLNNNGGHGYKGFSILETPGISVENDEKKLTIGFKQHFVDDEELISHLKSYPYKDENDINNIAELISYVENQEGGYGKDVIATLNSIMRELDEIENIIEGIQYLESPYIKLSEAEFRGKFHVPASIPNAVLYNKHGIIQCIIDEIDFKRKNFIIGNIGVGSYDGGYEILSYRNHNLDDKQLTIFLNICQKVSDKHSEELKNIQIINMDILNKYKKINEEYNKVMQTFETGLPMKGSCKVCEQIDGAKMNQKLMAYKLMEDK